MFAAFGLYAAAGALRLAGRRREPEAVSGLAPALIVAFGALLPLAARPEGRVLWAGGMWVAAAGAVLGFLSALSLGDCFGIAPAMRGVVSKGPYRVMRHPMAVSFILIAGGFLAVHFNPWNTTVLGISSALAVVSALLEERLLLGDGRYRDYAARVRWRFVPGLI
jgi:protein-S-isoprenylcysteine O-methyltransferase Ste14